MGYMFIMILCTFSYRPTYFAVGFQFYHRRPTPNAGFRFTAFRELLSNVFLKLVALRQLHGYTFLRLTEPIEHDINFVGFTSAAKTN
jgi:hypothetical protein